MSRLLDRDKLLFSPKAIPAKDSEDGEGEEDDVLDGDEFYAFYRIQTDAGDIDEYPKDPRFEYAAGEEDDREHA